MILIRGRTLQICLEKNWNYISVYCSDHLSGQLFDLFDHAEGYVFDFVLVFLFFGQNQVPQTIIRMGRVIGHFK